MNIGTSSRAKRGACPEPARGSETAGKRTSRRPDTDAIRDRVEVGRRLLREAPPTQPSVEMALHIGPLVRNDAVHDGVPDRSITPRPMMPEGAICPGVAGA